MDKSLNSKHKHQGEHFKIYINMYILHTCIHVSCVPSDRFKQKTGPNKTNSITSIFQCNYQQCTNPLDSAGLVMELISITLLSNTPTLGAISQ